MDTGLNIRPVQAPSVAPVRLQPAPERQVVRTELSETQSVQAATKTVAVSYDSKDAQTKLRAQLNAAVEGRSTEPRRTVERDAATQELIFRKISAETGQIVAQFPDEAILRQRAYAVQLRRAEFAAALEVKPDAAQDKVA
jgi:hypothetical protein